MKKWIGSILMLAMMALFTAPVLAQNQQQPYNSSGQQTYQQYGPPAAYESQAESNVLEWVLVLFLVLIFVVAIGLFVGFMVIMKKNERNRTEEREAIISSAQETIKAMNESLAAQQLKMEEQRKEFEQRLTEQSSMEQDMIDDVTQRVLVEKRTTMSLTYTNGERVNHTQIVDAHDRKGAPRRYKIGRSQQLGCDLIIPGDHSVAREQCVISFNGTSPDEKYYVLDLGGANTTQIQRGAEKITIDGKLDLLDGDILILGRTHLRVALYQATSELDELQS